MAKQDVLTMGVTHHACEIHICVFSFHFSGLINSNIIKKYHSESMNIIPDEPILP